MDPEAQRKMAEMIRETNVKENYELAHEEMPESFGRVIMLYVDATVNNVKVPTP
jgi:DNA damage-inducible protein 1